MKTFIYRIFRLFHYAFNYLFFELPKGVDFSIRDKQINADRDLNGYARTSRRALVNLMKLVDIKGKNFLDIGSGKGAVVYDAFILGAKRSVGIEFNNKLHLIALNNFDRLRCSKTCISNNIDARKFYGYAEFDIYFLFNPFSNDVYFDVISVLKSQIDSDLKERWLIAYGRSNENAILQIDNITLYKRGVCPYRNTGYGIYKIN